VLEIESCASGGARVDLGILQRTDRVWVSDCNDALERQAIQQGTRLLLPLELMGCHVGPPRSHTTSRTHDLSFRAATALFGHFGIEWDIASADAPDRAALAAVIAAYRRLRPLLHTGELITADHPDPSATVYGVVATDRSHAVFCYAQLSMTRFETPLPATIPGLDPERTYLVERLAPAGGPRLRERALLLEFTAV
jgi:alpha-galactosidase